MKTIRLLLCIITGVLLTSLSAKATPYAAGVSISGGTVNWHLNESVTNGIIYVLFNNGTVSNYIGNNVAAGPQSFSLGAHTNFAIHIFNIGTGTPHQISPSPGTTSPSSPLTDVFGPRGVGVNRNPSSTNFGRIYFVNASPGSDSVRATTRGAYALNADFTDAFGYGATAMPTNLSTVSGGGAVTWGSSTTYGLWRVFVGPDDVVYIAGGGTLVVGPGVTMCPPDLSSATYLFPLNGSSEAAGQYVNCVSTPNVTGSYAAGNMTLYTCEWDRTDPVGNYQTVWQYPFYTTTNTVSTPAPLTFTGHGTPLPLPWNLSVSPNYLPTAGNCGSTYGYGGSGNPNSDVGAGIGTVNTVLSDFYIAPDGKFFCMEERGSATGNVTLWVYDTITNGSCLLWDSLDANNGTDPFATAYSVCVSPDDQFVAFGESSASGNAGNDGQILVVGLDSQPAATGVNVSGLPDFSTISRIPYDGNSSLRGTAWDMADNVYCVSGSDDSMRAFTLGQTTTTVTANDITGTNGTFTLSFAPLSVTVSADESLISQPNTYGTPTSGTFTLTRSGGSIAGPLTAFFSLGGTATNGSTYSTSATNSVTFPAGSATVQVTITALTNDVEATTLNVVLSLSGSTDYSPIPPNTATIAIANTGPQQIGITSVALPSMYRGLSNDYASFIITRYGDTNAPQYTIPATSFTYGGTAALTNDYAPIGAVTFNPGDQFETVEVANPVATGVYHGNETILVSLNTNAGVPITSYSQTASMTLVDNADPPATVLWSDTLATAVDSTNWTLTFANSNLASTTVLPVLISKYPNYTASNPDPNPVDDFDVEFGYNVTSDNVGYSPTMILKGWTNALKMTVNKNASYVNSHGASAGVNVYPAGKKFSGNYAFRFSMALSEGTVSTTEYDCFGINHYGTNCNWFASDYTGNSGTTNSDGIWTWIDSDVDGQTGINTYILAGPITPGVPNTGYALLENVAALTAPYTNWFKHPTPYNGFPAGVPNVGNGGTANAWADVEVKQVNNVITMSINKFPILVYANNGITNATSGDVMLGYDDPYASVGTIAGGGASGAAVYYSNARVVQLTPPTVSSSSLSGTNLTIKFTDSDTDDTAASFELLGATTLSGTWAPVAATFSQSTATGGWQAVVAVPNGTVTKFYQVVRIN